MPRSDLAATNASEITVSELSGALKRTIEDRFGYVRVRGEISGYQKMVATLRDRRNVSDGFNHWAEIAGVRQGE